jgi:NAD(P) transhydrogenase subunit alpha
MYAKNITTFLQLLIKEGQVNLDREDEIVRETLVTYGGEVENAKVRETLAPTEATAGAARAREE